jgi:Icc-related predicted phosphoesterase
VRLYYASDIHGSEKLFRKFLNSAAFYEADVLILGGDLTGKVMVPIVETGPDRWTTKVFGKQEEITGEAELNEIEKRIRFNGFYPLRCDRDEYERLQNDDAHRDRVFRQLMRDELRRWVNLAHDKLASTSVRCFVMPGNDDEWDIDEVLDAAPEPVENPDGKVVALDGFQMLSSAWASPTPWDSPRELPEDELLERLTKLTEELADGVSSIFNLHCPPHNSTLDYAPELTDDLRVVKEGGEPKMVPVGSTAVRKLIETHQPVLGLHGHVHESRGITQIGDTLCINPGSTYGEGVLDGAIVDLDDGRVASHQLVSG